VIMSSTFAARSEDSKAFRKIAFQFGGFKLRYAWVSQRGYYPEDLDKANQDAHSEHENFAKGEGVEDCAMFGVYDGHGKTGDLCSRFTRDVLPPLLAKELGKEQSTEVALKIAFETTNEQLHAKDECDDTMSGTTASAYRQPARAPNNRK
jgi:serine/threonine protein phosphatase PrpC